MLWQSPHHMAYKHIGRGEEGAGVNVIWKFVCLVTVFVKVWKNAKFQIEKGCAWTYFSLNPTHCTETDLKKQLCSCVDLWLVHVHGWKVFSLTETTTNNKKNKIRKTLITTDFYLKRFLFKRLILKITVWNNSCLESLVSLGTVDFGQNPLWLLSVFFLFLRCAWLAAPETWWCVLTSSALSTTSKSSVGTCTVTMVTCSATLDKSTTMSSEFQKKLKICVVSDLVLFKKINK